MKNDTVDGRIVFRFLALWCALVAIATLICIYNDAIYLRGEGGLVDTLSATQLFAIACLSFLVFLSADGMRKGSFWRHPSLVWLVIAVGFLFLTADEALMIHETIDQRIHSVFNMQETGLTDRIDDMLILMYGLVGIGVLCKYRVELKNHYASLPFFVGGFVLLFAMVGCDVVTNRRDLLPLIFHPDLAETIHDWLSEAENVLKILSEAVFMFAFCVALRTARQIAQRPPMASKTT